MCLFISLTSNTIIAIFTAIIEILIANSVYQTIYLIRYAIFNFIIKIHFIHLTSQNNKYIKLNI